MKVSARGVNPLAHIDREEQLVEGRGVRDDHASAFGSSSGVRRALGREPRDFADYAARTAATGIWAEQAARSAS